MPFNSQAYLAGEGSRLRSTHLSLGHHPNTLDELMITPTDRTMGMHLIGKAGSGKSSEIKNLVYQDAVQGNAVIVIDPHGDLVDEIVAELPQACVSRMFIPDMRDEAFPFGGNALDMAGKLDTEEQRTQNIERILHIFDVLWEDVLKQQYLPMLLRFAVIALLDTPGSTLVDMIDFFRKDEFRAQILSRVKDKSVRDYFHDEYDRHSDVERNRRVAPLMNRLHSLFVGRSLVRNILGQRKNSIDFKRAIEQRQIILIKLPTTTMREDARLLGTVLLAQISAAIFEQRLPVSLYVDEFQNFATRDLERFVTEGRKFGVQLHVAHQNLGQLPDYLVRATGGMHTKVVFRVTAEDARALAPGFPARPATEGNVDAHTSMCKYLLEDGIDEPHVRKFVEIYLRPMQTYKHGGQVDLQDKQWHVNKMRLLLWGVKGGGVTRNETFVPDPTPYLDGLLRDVMRTRNPMLTIPWEAMVGFSNSGRKFYTAARHALEEDLGPNVQFPLNCVTPYGNGLRWIKAPITAREQMLHCIFFLRMTMMHLAEHPVLKGKTPTIDYGQILIQLPVRMALVKVGDEVGQIVTNDTPRPLEGEALKARRFFLREQTRQVYCHPRGQIESLIEATTPPDPVTLRRWEEVRIGEESTAQ